LARRLYDEFNPLETVIAFMIIGPATKITNFGALKIVLGVKNFVCYLAFIILFALLSGFCMDYVFRLNLSYL
jgi:uncharacterized membrane protein YraQ (UPF0718 family)